MPAAARLERAVVASSSRADGARLRRAATAVAVLSSPALFVWLNKHESWSVAWSLLSTVLAVFAFRGGLDLLFRRFIPWPSLFGTDSPELREEDVVARRRVWFWRFWYRLAWFVLLVILAIYFVRVLKYGVRGREHARHARTTSTTGSATRSRRSPPSSRSGSSSSRSSSSTS